MGKLISKKVLLKTLKSDGTFGGKFVPFESIDKDNLYGLVTINNRGEIRAINCTISQAIDDVIIISEVPFQFEAELDFFSVQEEWFKYCDKDITAYAVAASTEVIKNHKQLAYVHDLLKAGKAEEALEYLKDYDCRGDLPY